MISRLPGELLYNIAGRLNEYEIYCLARSNRRLFQILQKTLYEENMLRNDGWSLLWAILNKQIETVQHSLQTGARSLGEALALAVETRQENIVHLLLTKASADFSPKYKTCPHVTNTPWSMDMSWTSQDHIFSRSTAAASLRRHEPFPSWLSYDALSPLSRALLNSHLDLSRVLIESAKFQVDYHEEEGRTPLSIIAEYGDSASLRLLLDLGKANVYSKDRKGRTAFSYSMENLDSAVFHEILEVGFIDVDEEDGDGCTPFHYAVAAGNLDAMECLLQMDINKDPVDPLLGNLPFIWERFHSQNGIELENADYIRFWNLLIQCEDFSIDNEDDCSYTTPLLLVAGGLGGGKVIRLLINSGKVFLNAQDYDKRNALSHAASDGHYTAVQALLESGKVDRDRRDSKGRTPFSYAAESGHKSAKLFIEAGGIDLDSRDDEGRTPLSYAAASGLKETVQLLVRNSRVDLNSQDRRGRSPFFHAAASASKECVQLFMETDGVDINLQDDQLRTPFTNAVASGSKEVVQLLLESGKFDPHHQDRYGQTPLSHATQSRAKECIKILFEVGDIDLDSRDVFGRTPLSYAAETMDYEIVRMLTDTGKVEFDSRDNQGRTPLSYAVANRQVEFTRFLLILKENYKKH